MPTAAGTRAPDTFKPPSTNSSGASNNLQRSLRDRLNKSPRGQRRLQNQRSLTQRRANRFNGGRTNAYRTPRTPSRVPRPPVRPPLRPPVAPGAAGGAAASGAATTGGIGPLGTVALGVAGFIGGFALGDVFVRPALGIEYPGGGGFRDWLGRQLPGGGSNIPSGSISQGGIPSIEGIDPYEGGGRYTLYNYSYEGTIISNGTVTQEISSRGENHQGPVSGPYGISNDQGFPAYAIRNARGTETIILQAFTPSQSISLDSFRWTPADGLPDRDRAIPQGRPSGGIDTPPLVEAPNQSPAPASPQRAPRAIPPPSPSPVGTPPQPIPSTPEPATDPGEEPIPTTNPRNVPFGALPALLPVAMPAVGPGALSGASRGRGLATQLQGSQQYQLNNPAQAGQTASPPVSPPRPVPPTAPGRCGCNGPIIQGQQSLSRGQQDLADRLESALNAANLGLNEQILSEVKRNGRGIGVDDLPASVPGNFAKPSAANKSISSLAGLSVWGAEILDGLIGQYPQKMDIDTPAGRQTIESPNVSETLQEMMGMLVGLTINSSQIMHTTSRTLHQAGSATQQAHLAHQYGRANAEFLGFEQRSVPVDIPLSYSPGKNPFEGFLGESTQKIRGFQNVDNQDLKSILAELLQAAAIIRAVYWRRLEPGTDFEKQIKDQFKGRRDFVDGNDDQSAAESDWEAYLNEVEQGFTTQTGDATPYGRDASERPKIRDVGPHDDTTPPPP